MFRTFSDFASANRHILWVGFFTFVIIYASSFVKGYGYFIDEFYYIACASHPALGYVDHPPLAPLVLTVFQFLFGDSLAAIRILPALGQACAVVLTGVLARQIGGGKTAQVLSAAAMAGSPMVLAFGGFYSMNAFEPLLATALVCHAVRMVRERNTKNWIAAGVLMGLGMMNKHTFALFILALTVALLMSGHWRLFASRWFVVGGILAFVIVLPNIVWQALNGYPSLEFYRNINESKNVYTPPLPFLTGQIISMSPATLPFWLGGTISLLLSKSMKEWRFLAFLFLLLFLFMMMSGTSRADRLLFAYPPVLAAGAVLWERLAVRYNARWLAGVFGVLLLAGIGAGLPIVLPYFSYEQVEAYTKFTGVNTEVERGKKPPLPQLIADRIGWEEKFALVLHAYNGLTDEEKKETIIAAGNYGQAGALELFGRKHGLPSVVSGHNNYYLWSKERLQGTILLQLDHAGSYDRLRERFASVVPCEGEFTNQFVSAHENNLKVFICTLPTLPYAEMLERAKMYH